MGISMSERDPSKTIEDLGTVLVTGGSGFVGGNFVRTLLSKGYKVKSFDIVPSSEEHPNLEIITGNICDKSVVEKACEGVDTVFHTAAIIGLKGGRAVSKEYRDQSYAINVEGTKNLLHALQKAGGKRFVYTASNSVVLEGKPVTLAKETMPYTNRFNDLYTETKVVAEKWVLEQNGKNGVLTCSIRPSGIWGPGDQTMFKIFFDQVIRGIFLAQVGNGTALIDNSYVHNLIHGYILAAQHLVEGGTSPGQAYFINDDDQVNMFEFSRPIMDIIGAPFPKIKVPYALVRFVMVAWQELHFMFKFPEPLLPPTAIERVGVTNTFSIEKARQDLGYEPLYTTAEAMEECKPFYKELFFKMKAAAGK
jgi:3beta-hydroxy-delta5-steroid dehydrogenase/steroid delta-isomerase